MLRWGLVLGAAVYLALALGTTEVNWVRVWEGLPRVFPQAMASGRPIVAYGVGGAAEWMSSSALCSASMIDAVRSGRTTTSHSVGPSQRTVAPSG